jgi:hypothetical protein
MAVEVARFDVDDKEDDEFPSRFSLLNTNNDS